MTFNPALHGLRALAALGVLLFHWTGVFPAMNRALENVSFLGTNWDLMFFVKMGWIGVDWFFVLSGYVLAATIWHSPLQWRDVLQFWKRRVLRIYPAIWLQLIIILLLFHHLEWLPAFDWKRTLANVVLWIRPLPYGLPSYNAVVWTLVLELSFYFMLPFILMAYRKTNIWTVLLGVLLINLFTRFGLHWLRGDPDYTPLVVLLRVLAPGLQVVFILGFALNHFAPLLTNRQRYLLLCVFGLAYVVLLHLGQPVNAEFARRGWEVFGWRTALSVAIATLVGLLLRPLPGFLWLGSRPLVWLGELSYGIYLWHLVVQGTLHRLLPDMFVTAIGSFVALLICLAITLVLAMMSYYWLERPILDRFARHRRASAATALATP
ncbi:MAG TPA: hypothetical protein DCY64_02950 [Hydrogenophaga sp.]|uniref:acyltransferase family protein n=1 Tax=Hydrogenophaga sp. TaxID=1904254 RepID=UPI0008B5B053|nr:acyltransferase [Hydrogenophaga sp.]OGA78275.1 MAG: hypothetical protein A2X73_09485 [Burkholderiales bacterium GWE1_65_30]OGA93111.1 MAG: hypothetical protein A2X72_08265 [Burkholderiales bacterium GWF1_66_17]HAX19227.1 hypothetical protein [Hydrogenophaga sp.]HBU18424.1 hypothetical protein [Hydrogenophaga sp.]